MKTAFVNTTFAALFGMLIATSCREKQEIEPAVSDNDMVLSTTQTDDADNTTSILDDALDNVNENLANISNGSRVEGESTCGYTVSYALYNTISGSNQKTVVFTYDGTSSCNLRTRKGSITATLTKGNFFSDLGAEYNIVFEGFGSTYRGKTFTLNGTQTVKNITGGLPRYVVFRPNQFTKVEHEVSGEMSLKFDESETARTWSVSRVISWENQSGLLSYTIKGAGSQDGYDNLSLWGINRNGNRFYTQITTPISANSSCGWYRPTSGSRLHTVKDTDGSNMLVIEATLNTGSDGCGNGYTITATNKNGRSRSRTVTY